MLSSHQLWNAGHFGVFNSEMYISERFLFSLRKKSFFFFRKIILKKYFLLSLTDYANRGEKKFGDKCESTTECGFPDSICDSKKRSCQCVVHLPVTNHIDKCGRGKPSIKWVSSSSSHHDQWARPYRNHITQSGSGAFTFCCQSVRCRWSL